MSDYDIFIYDKGHKFIQFDEGGECTLCGAVYPSEEMCSEMKLELGMRLKDRITGFEGVAVAKSEWLYGCIRFGLQSDKLKEDGSLLEAQWFDEPQLEKIEEVVKYEESNTGGSRDNPPRVKDPVRC